MPRRIETEGRSPRKIHLRDLDFLAQEGAEVEYYTNLDQVSGQNHETSYFHCRNEGNSFLLNKVQIEIENAYSRNVDCDSAEYQSHTEERTSQGASFFSETAYDVGSTDKTQQVTEGGL
jgi:hypothetical protein